MKRKATLLHVLFGLTASMNVLHYNVGFECMSALNVGSGRFASKQCIPGHVDTGKRWTDPGYWQAFRNSDIEMLRKIPSEREPAEKRRIFDEKLYDNYMSSCSYNMLTGMKAWHAAENFDLITLAEVCNPGLNNELTRHWGKGFVEDDGSIEAYNARQCSLPTFNVLSSIFAHHEYVVNPQPVRWFWMHQLTIWNEAVFGKPDLIIMTEMVEGRPVTALMFKEKRVMVVNCHGTHFRKYLIRGPNEFENAAYMTSYVNEHYQQVGGTGSLEEPHGTKFSLSHLNTEGLQKLYGGFLSNIIALEMMNTCKDGHVSCSCATLEECQAEIAHDIDRIILMGDMNDETGELISLPMFGKTVKIRPNLRKRTCCSDRDERFRAAYFNKEDDPVYATTDDYPDHAIGSWMYLLEESKYSGGCNNASTPCQQQFTSSAPNALLVGATTAADTETGQHSRYPFTSDLIMDSFGDGPTAFDFPPGYVQSISGGTISDHDPVSARLAPLQANPQGSEERPEQSCRGDLGDSCDSSVNIEVGDIAEIFGLESQTVKLASGYYGKVISFDSDKQRFGIRLGDGRLLSVRPQDLRMGMKERELSSEDERLLLDLKPAPEDLRGIL